MAKDIQSEVIEAIAESMLDKELPLLSGMSEDWTRQNLIKRRDRWVPLLNEVRKMFSDHGAVIVPREPTEARQYRLAKCKCGGTPKATWEPMFKITCSQCGHVEHEFTPQATIRTWNKAMLAAQESES